MHTLEEILARYRTAEAELLEAVRMTFPRGAALTVTFPMEGEEQGAEQGSAMQAEECGTALVAVQTTDVLHNIALQVRLERSGRVIELPLWLLLGQAVV